MLQSVGRLPHAPGVYRFRGGGRVLYVGRTADLRRRVASYWGDLRDRRHLRAMVPRVEDVEAVECDSAHEAAWLERNLLRARRPPWNRSRGEESPVYVRLDRRPRSPGITVVHRLEQARGGGPYVGVEFFGPYLGSQRASLAVAGLSRALPVEYTAENLSGGQIDLARVLGFGRPDRENTVAMLRGVLRRERDAVATVRAELTRRRDDAAGALAFERAGQVQAELEAVDWLVAEQKVNVLEPVSHDIAGWSDGLLVQFAVRDGRLSSWTLRPCSRESAQALLAVTPPEWMSFAERNARLAATLRCVGERSNAVRLADP